MTHLLLSHLSKDNNSPQLAQELFTQNANGVTVSVASRYKAMDVIIIAEDKIAPIEKPVQLGLFSWNLLSALVRVLTK